MLRRFIGRDWEVFLGGRLRRVQSDTPTSNWLWSMNPDQVISQSESQAGGRRDSNYGSFKLGTGRTIMRSDRFWLNATFNLSYSWENHDSYSLDVLFQSSGQSSFWENEVDRHWRKFDVALGLRPVFDLTRRLSLAMGFGFGFSITDRIEDRHRYSTYYNIDGVFDHSYYDHDRTASREENVYTFGSFGLDYLSFMFRF